LFKYRPIAIHGRLVHFLGRCVWVHCANWKQKQNQPNNDKVVEVTTEMVAELLKERRKESSKKEMERGKTDQQQLGVEWCLCRVI
jgi:hypothetical protein